MELNTKDFSCGLVIGLLLAGCAGTTFPYRYYWLDKDVNYTTGKMLSDKPENDIPFSTCIPNEKNMRPCTCLLTDVFLNLKLDLLDTQDKLKQCEKDKAQLKES